MSNIQSSSEQPGMPWIGAQRRDLAWQVAEYRKRSFPDYRFPKDILRAFPALRQPLEPLPEKR